MIPIKRKLSRPQIADISRTEIFCNSGVLKVWERTGHCLSKQQSAGQQNRFSLKLLWEWARPQQKLLGCCRAYALIMYPAPSIGKESHKNQLCLSGKGGPEKSTLAILGHKWRTDHPFFWPPLFCGRFTRGKKSSQNDSMNNFSAKMGFHTFDARNPKTTWWSMRKPFVHIGILTINSPLRPSCITPSWLERVQQPLEVVGGTKERWRKGAVDGRKRYSENEGSLSDFFWEGVCGEGRAVVAYSFSSS